MSLGALITNTYKYKQERIVEIQKFQKFTHNDTIFFICCYVLCVSMFSVQTHMSYL